ncbi:MAG TPA: DUF1684 domain-containing protein [Thermoanaerobaculia bacterium]|nr:DUF1684 domain-containing protein [Thermoanaerobaculia bacterium]
MIPGPKNLRLAGLAGLLLAFLPGLALAQAAPAAGPDAANAADAADAPNTANTPDTAYRQEVEAWRQDREKGLKQEDGWFSLVGLFWLKEGENRFGSDLGNTVILPEGKAPAEAGTLVRKGGAVQIRVKPGVGITHQGQPVEVLDLLADTSGQATVLELGTLSFHVIQRGDRVGVRVKDSKSPALAAFHGLDNYPVQPAWKVEARFEPYTPAKTVPIPNVLGQVDDSPSPGAVVFDRGGKTHRLDALEGSPDGGLFLIFADATNGKETYGAGRFLVTDPPKDGKVVVDFNKAYNPPCAYSAYATCPLPPQQNRLALRVEAGEKKYGEGHP